MTEHNLHHDERTHHMDFDTAIFLDVCERQAKANQNLEGFGERELTEDQILIALLIASADILGTIPLAKLASEFDMLRSTAVQVENVAEKDGFVVIHEEGR